MIILMTKYIFITGGVVSSLGKGLAASSLAALLQARNFKVRLRKLDPYLNVDAGTMSPYQHGEVFVTEDGAETDLDLGHYERFTGVNAKKLDSITSGKIYKSVLDKERKGEYLGATIQVVPHVIDEIKYYIQKDIDDEDFVICEIGGTVGDIEGLPFLEAIRQIRNDLGVESTLFIHVTLLPYIQASGEMKTKPSQHSVKELLSVGIQPDMLLCRTSIPISEETKNKLGLFCNIPKNRVIELCDLKSIYEAPVVFHKNNLDIEVCKYFGKNGNPINLNIWHDLYQKMSNLTNNVTVGIIGKYIQLPDAYKSIIESLKHAGFANSVNVKINLIDSEQTDNLENELKKLDGIIVPGGFGGRGIEGKISAIKYARENNVPFLGICFGMQLAVIETATNVLKLDNVNSTEIDPNCSNPVVALMTEWMSEDLIEKRSSNSNLGGTMRLGVYECAIDKNSKTYSIYGSDKIFERHRHRYEVNSNYVSKIESTGLKFVGKSPDGTLPEIIELENHKWFIASQFHPEFKSRPFAPHPLFFDLIKTLKSEK